MKISIVRNKQKMLLNITSITIDKGADAKGLIIEGHDETPLEIISDVKIYMEWPEVEQIIQEYNQ